MAALRRVLDRPTVGTEDMCIGVWAGGLNTAGISKAEIYGQNTLDAPRLDRVALNLGGYRSPVIEEVMGGKTNVHVPAEDVIPSQSRVEVIAIADGRKNRTTLIRRSEIDRGLFAKVSQ